MGEVVPPILSAAQVSMFVNLRDDGEAVLASHEALRRARDNWSNIARVEGEHAFAAEARVTELEAKSAEDERRFHEALADEWIKRDALRAALTDLCDAVVYLPYWSKPALDRARAVLEEGATDG